MIKFNFVDFLGGFVESMVTKPVDKSAVPAFTFALYCQRTVMVSRIIFSMKKDAVNGFKL